MLPVANCLHSSSAHICRVEFVSMARLLHNISRRFFAQQIMTASTYIRGSIRSTAVDCDLHMSNMIWTIYRSFLPVAKCFTQPLRTSLPSGSVWHGLCTTSHAFLRNISCQHIHVRSTEYRSAVVDCDMYVMNTIWPLYRSSFRVRTVWHGCCTRLCLVDSVWHGFCATSHDAFLHNKSIR